MQRVYGLFVHQLEAGDVIGERTVVPGATPGKHACSILCGAYASAIVIDQAQFRIAMDQLSGQVCSVDSLVSRLHIAAQWQVSITQPLISSSSTSIFQLVYRSICKVSLSSCQNKNDFSVRSNKSWTCWAEVLDQHLIHPLTKLATPGAVESDPSHVYYGMLLCCFQCIIPIPPVYRRISNAELGCIAGDVHLPLHSHHRTHAALATLSNRPVQGCKRPRQYSRDAPARHVRAARSGQGGDCTRARTRSCDDAAGCVPHK